MGTASQRGLKSVGLFLFFGAAMTFLAGTLLIHPGTILDRAWVLNPVAQRELARFGKPLGIVFVLLGAVFVVAAIGWLRHRYWAWRLTVVVMAAQLVGDLINFIRGDHLRGGLGFLIAGALLLYLVRRDVRVVFMIGNRALETRNRRSGNPASHVS